MRVYDSFFFLLLPWILRMTRPREKRASKKIKNPRTIASYSPRGFLLISCVYLRWTRDSDRTTRIHHANPLSSSHRHIMKGLESGNDRTLQVLKQKACFTSFAEDQCSRGLNWIPRRRKSEKQQPTGMTNNPSETEQTSKGNEQRVADASRAKKKKKVIGDNKRV